MNNSDKYLFFGVLGTFIGIGLFYGFHFIRGISSPLLLGVSEIVVEPGATPTVTATIFLNFFHTIVSGIGVVVPASLLIILIFKERRLIYCIIPSLVFLVFSYKDYMQGSSNGWVEMEPGVFIVQLINPIFFVLFFALVFWVSDKLIAPNKVRH